MQLKDIGGVLSDPRQELLQYLHFLGFVAFLRGGDLNSGPAMIPKR